MDITVTQPYVAELLIKSSDNESHLELLTVNSVLFVSYKCNTCGQHYDQHTLLQRHARKHHLHLSHNDTSHHELSLLNESTYLQNICVTLSDSVSQSETSTCTNATGKEEICADEQTESNSLIKAADIPEGSTGVDGNTVIDLNELKQMNSDNIEDYNDDVDIKQSEHFQDSHGPAKNVISEDQAVHAANVNPSTGTCTNKEQGQPHGPQSTPTKAEVKVPGKTCGCMEMAEHANASSSEEVSIEASDQLGNSPPLSLRPHDLRKHKKSSLVSEPDNVCEPRAKRTVSEPPPFQRQSKMLTRASKARMQSSSIPSTKVAKQKHDVKKVDREKSTTCNICRKTFSSTGHLNCHMLRYHAEADVTQCIKCGKSFKKKRDLTDHLSECNLSGRLKKVQVDSYCVDEHKNIQSHNCDLCGHGFPTQGRLRKHRTIHVNDRPYKCAECSKTYKRSDQLADHMKMHGGDTSMPLKCDQCGQGFIRPTFLKRHKLSLCPAAEKPLPNVRVQVRADLHPCSHCDKKFKSIGEVVKHTRIHTGEKPYTCEICSRSFSHKYSLTVHLRYHSGEKPYQCSQCGKCFAQMGYFNAHVKSHSGEPTCQCSVCGEMFKWPTSLKVHMRSHTGETPYECTYCSKRFTAAGAYQLHVRTHTGDKPFKCAECEKCFLSSSKLSRHKKIHSKEKVNGAPRVKKISSRSPSSKKSRSSCSSQLPSISPSSKIQPVDSISQIMPITTGSQIASVISTLTSPIPPVSSSLETRALHPSPQATSVSPISSTSALAVIQVLYRCPECNTMYKREVDLMDHRAKEHSTSYMILVDVR